VTDDGEPRPDPPRLVPPPARPGASIFTIEGRAAPGLFVVGWLASILGLSLAVVGALGNSALLLYVVGPGLLSLGLIAGAGNQAIERRARGESYAGPSPFVVFAAIIAVSYFVGALVGVALDAVFSAAGIDVAGPAGQLLSGILTAVVFVGLVRLLVVGTGALTWSEMGMRRIDRRAVADFLLGVAYAFPVIAVTGVVAAFLVGVFRVVSPSPLPPTGELGGLLVQLVAGAVIAPVAEEVVFRGFAVTAWRRAIGAQPAIIRATLLFALAHVVSIQAASFGEAIGLIAVGMGTRLPVAYALGWLFVRRESLWAPIGLHAAFNGLLLVLAHLALTSASP
jgi:membrane protease YdiL (CAAX protease family)